jgi:hypothetical protein
MRQSMQQRFKTSVTQAQVWNGLKWFAMRVMRIWGMYFLMARLKPPVCAIALTALP